MSDDQGRWRERNARPRDWHIEDRTPVFQGFYRIDKLHFRHALHAGGETASIDRELFVRGNVVGLLPYDPVRDEVVLIEQFRVGAINQTPDPWLVEIIAGMIDTDESPEEVVIREAQEEAGLVIHDPRLISHYLASPGSSTEEVFLFFAETDLSGAGGIFGLDHENEDILVRAVAAEDAIAMLETREVRNALSIIALQWFRAYRETIRATG